MNELERQLVEHLKREAPQGLPRSWLSLKSDLPVESENFREEQTGEEVVGKKSNLALAEVPRDDYSHLGLEELRGLAMQCTKCRLCEGRNKVVFGVGKTDRPVIAFVGEGPGADEDRLGEPFVGRAGALLTAAITKGLGLSREEVYIANVVKCRPPENRAPLPDETASCTPYLYRQLEIIQPQVIVTLGQPAQMALSGVEMGITKLRGNWQNWRGIKLMPTFHPAYLLRNPPMKKFFWEDLKTVMAEVGLPIPSGEAKV